MKFLRKGVFWDNIKSHKKQGFTLCLEDTFFEKPQEGSQFDPPRPIRVNFNF